MKRTTSCVAKNGRISLSLKASYTFEEPDLPALSRLYEEAATLLLHDDSLLLHLQLDAFTADDLRDGAFIQRFLDIVKRVR